MANQEKLRARKDEKIHDMAMEQKRRMEGAKKSGHILRRQIGDNSTKAGTFYASSYKERTEESFTFPNVFHIRRQHNMTSYLSG